VRVGERVEGGACVRGGREEGGELGRLFHDPRLVVALELDGDRVPDRDTRALAHLPVQTEKRAPAHRRDRRLERVSVDGHANRRALRAEGLLHVERDDDHSAASARGFELGPEPPACHDARIAPRPHGFGTVCLARARLEALFHPRGGYGMAFPLRLLDLFLPRRCASCGAGEELLCAACRDALRRLGDPLCARCGAPTAWPVGRCRECAGRRLAFATARAAVAYDGPARPLVAAWKERGLRPLAREFGALVAETVSRPPVDEVTFVPADPDRSLKRGQNAAEALARELARCWELPVRPLLVRAEPARPQRGLSRGERRRNVHRSFAAAAARPGGYVALVDDVYTTGATVGAAATELRRAGARAVHVVTFARTVRR